MNQNIITQLEQQFLEKFPTQSSTLKSFSPGRINLIGEHIDYNDGKIFPAAIDMGIYVVAQKTNTNTVSLHSVDMNETVAVDLTPALEVQSTSWANYIIGVVAQFHKKGIQTSGFDLAFIGDLPIGAGLSSSAALECAVAILLNKMWDSNLDKMELLKMAQKAEHDFAGVQCGIMDQFTSMMGKKDHAILLDTESLAYKYHPLELGDYALLLFDSQVKHSLASSEYNLRRIECEKALAAIKSKFPSITSFNKCSIDKLEAVKDKVDEVIYRRGKYVIEEIERVTRFADAMVDKDFATLGTLMYETHHGLSKDYEVSCEELDFLIDEVQKESAVMGARMMGGGFGGCTINLIEKSSLERIKSSVEASFLKKFKRPTKSIEANIANGAVLL